MVYNRLGLCNELRANCKPLGTNAMANVNDFVDMCESVFQRTHSYEWLRQHIHVYLVNNNIINDVDFTDMVSEIVFDYLNHRK